MPCVQKNFRLEEEAYIKQHRKDVDLYTGITKPVEILKIMHAPKEYNPLENLIPYPISSQKLYHQLSVDEQEQMELYAITLMDDGDFNQAEQILTSLICFANARVERGMEELFLREVYYPGILYKNAGSVIRDKLIRRVKRDSENRNHILSALAWIGDKEVVRLFAKWKKKPPRWASELYVSPENYSYAAGWELDQNGGKRGLFYPDSYYLEVSQEIEADLVGAPVVSLQSDEQECLWCKFKLTVLFDCQLQDPLLEFLTLEGDRLKIAACLHCNCYGTVFMKVNADGSFSWSEYNQVFDFLPEPVQDDEFTWKTMILSNEQRGPYEAAEWTLEAPASQIGGHPSWIQDAEYPSCPCCSETMMFIGQVDMEQAADSEGIYYAFLCGTCMISAVNYQQT